MRKLLTVLLGILIVCFCFFFIRQKPVQSQVIPEVLDVRPSQATIAWLSGDSYRGRVSCWSPGSDNILLSAVDGFGASRQHEVVLNGLQPGTRYTYQIDDSDKNFQFQTQPATNTPFSFLVVWGDTSDRIVSLVRSEFAEFIIYLSWFSPGERDFFPAVRPYVPVYNLAGIDSPYLRRIKAQSGQGVLFKPWSLDWGGLRLVFTDDTDEINEIESLLDSAAAHTIGMVVSAGMAGRLDTENIAHSSLHEKLIVHNGRYPTTPVSFVMIVGGESKGVHVNGITYYGTGSSGQGDDSGAIRMDVDVDSVRAAFIDVDKEIVLKESPMGQKLTCEDCRRLADKGAYEASISAYEEFIETNRGHFQIDDAFYSIADIYDFRLFEYNKALLWYRQLIDEYPHGTLVPLAKQRIKYITEYSDYNYEPLSRFERIRSVEFSRKAANSPERDKLLEKVDKLVQEYPDSCLAPVMQLWLATQYRTRDADKAVQAYCKLRENYDGSDEAREAIFEIGSTYYDAGRYRDAVRVFREALNELPTLTDTINAQIGRAERNIRRKQIAYSGWAIIIAMSVLLVLIKPRQIEVGGMSRSFAFFVVLMILLYAGAWLIHEQFNSIKEMHLLVLSFAAVASFSVYIATNFTQKVSYGVACKKPLIASAIGTFAGLLFFLAGIYAAIYCIYEHYLILVKL